MRKNNNDTHVHTQSYSHAHTHIRTHADASFYGSFGVRNYENWTLVDLSWATCHAQQRRRMPRYIGNKVKGSSEGAVGKGGDTRGNELRL